MAADFNPYHVWLGIPPDEQPANHYRLLGIRLFEIEADVIDSAADRQMAHLRSFQSGKHGELSQQLLNEVAAARVCLLDPKKRAAYDQKLRATLSSESAAVASAAVPTAATTTSNRAHTRVVADVPQPADQWADLLGDPAAKPAYRPAGKSSSANARKGSAAKRAANNRNLSIGITAAVLLIAAAGIGWLALNGSSSDGTLVFDWPPDERADTSVTVDDIPLPAPASGAWEYHGPAGSHHVVALREAYKLDANVALVAGQRLAAPTDWKPQAVLVLNWPLALRAGAELKIDGHAYPISQHDPLEVPVAPGRHVVQITRSGSAPIVAKAVVEADGREAVSIAPPEASVADMPNGGELIKTECIGEESGNPYEDVSRPNGLVVGFNCTVVPFPGRKRSSIVGSIQPVYLKGGQRTASSAHGQPEGDTIMVEAKQGYAVAGLVVRAGSRIDGFKVIFMRIGKSALDTKSSYESDWIGGRGGISEKTLGGDGRPVIGIYGFNGHNLHSLGLIQTK